ncbi:LPD23 domain-containing protein [Vibrio sp. D431a]|uniref:LPD23 domain-containing protein n=1 Tax=Vibrio sp. D431a TaxID=2837388 RepID=UPI00255242E8|nr:LPD23 domain-containing protein [Vibrio sp. D431a]MDK9790126.1 hypothetical protein [Vibrio sp. D431a]
MFVGDKSRLGRIAISKAKELIKKGMSDADVFSSTGCFIGLDGLWRHEVDVSALNYTNEFQLFISNTHGEFDVNTIFYTPKDDNLFNLSVIGFEHPDNGFFLKDLTREQVTHYLPDDIMSKIDNLEGTSYRDGSYMLSDLDFKANPSVENAKLICLMDALEGGEFLWEYSQFWNVFIQIDESMSGASVTYLEDDNRPHDACEYLITLGKRKDIQHLVHEIQHIVQRLNGFAVGGSPLNFKPLNGNEVDLERSQSELHSLYKDKPEFADRVFEIKREFLILSSEYSNDKGTCDWMSVPKDKSSKYFKMLSDLKQDFPKESEEETNYLSRLAGKLRRGSSYNLSPEDQYMSLAGELEAYKADSRALMSLGERRSTMPFDDKYNEQPLIIFNRDELINYKVAYDKEGAGVTSYTDRRYKEFSTIFTRNTATPDEVLASCAELMLEIYHDLSQELENGNSLKNDYYRLMAYLNLTPEEYAGLYPSEKAESIKKFTDGFKAYIATGVAPNKLKAVFAQLKMWVVAVFRGVETSPIKEDIDNRDLYERMFSGSITIDKASSFQDKLYNQVKNATEFTPEVALTLSALTDSMLQSVAERSGLPRDIIDERYNITVKPHIASKIRLTPPR